MGAQQGLLTRETGIEDAGYSKAQAGLPASLQTNRILSIKRVLPKRTANSSTLFGPAISTGFNVSVSATST
jgi:hypothetical protein